MTQDDKNLNKNLRLTTTEPMSQPKYRYVNLTPEDELPPDGTPMWWAAPQWPNAFPHVGYTTCEFKLEPNTVNTAFKMPVLQVAPKGVEISQDKTTLTFKCNNTTITMQRNGAVKVDGVQIACHESITDPMFRWAESFLEGGDRD